MKKELSPQQWSEWFVTDGWLAYRALIEKRLEAQRQALEAVRGARMEGIAIQTISINSIIEELKNLIEILPENLENPKGEKDAKGRDEEYVGGGCFGGTGTRVGRDH